LAGWLAWPVLSKRAWPKIRSQSKRAITPEEHALIIAAEGNVERRAYYQLLYETGASQTDAASLSSANIDRQSGVLVYRRKKLGPGSEPARMTIGRKLLVLLQSLPETGDLFPTIRHISSNHRAAEFRRRCRLLGIKGVSLHSLPAFVGAASQDLWLSPTICPGGAGPQQPGRPRSLRPGRDSDLSGA